METHKHPKVTGSIPVRRIFDTHRVAILDDLLAPRSLFGKTTNLRYVETVSLVGVLETLEDIEHSIVEARRAHVGAFASPVICRR